MRTRKLSELRADAAWLSDQPTPTTSTFITTDDWTRRINEGIAELFNLVVSQAGEQAYQRTTTITTTSGTSVYPLPADFYELTRVMLALNTTDFVTLERFTEAERPFLLSSTPGWNGEPFKYSIMGKALESDVQHLELLPTPAQSLTVYVAYVYAPTTLVNDTDVLDGFGGFEDYAVTFAARRAAMKEENYDLADRLSAELERIKGNVLQMSKQFDDVSPPRINMTRNPWRPRYARRRW